MQVPDLPRDVRFSSNIMVRNLLIHSCADRERALATASDVVGRTSWQASGTRLVDAIVGIWLAPVTPQTDGGAA